MGILKGVFHWFFGDLPQEKGSGFSLRSGLKRKQIK